MRKDIGDIKEQMSHLMDALKNRPSGSLPSDTVVPKREHINAITLRSGKELEAAPLLRRRFMKEEFDR